MDRIGDSLVLISWPELRKLSRFEAVKDLGGPIQVFLRHGKNIKSLRSRSCAPSRTKMVSGLDSGPDKTGPVSQPRLFYPGTPEQRGKSPPGRFLTGRIQKKISRFHHAASQKYLFRMDEVDYNGDPQTQTPAGLLKALNGRGIPHGGRFRHIRKSQRPRLSGQLSVNTKNRTGGNLRFQTALAGTGTQYILISEGDVAHLAGETGPTPYLSV
jgi:hypothetical protein